MKIMIRPMEEKDAPAVFRLANESRLAYWSEVDYQAESKRNDAYAAVSLIREKIVGFIIMRLIMTELCRIDFDGKKTVEKPNAFAKTVLSVHKEKHSREHISEKSAQIEAEIYNIAVERNLRNRGIGGELLKTANQHLLEFGAEQATVWLEVRESNHGAVNFYRANGFQISSRRLNYYTEPAENALIMRADFETGRIAKNSRS